MEIWKDIKGYEGLYQVSNLGNIKSMERFCVHKYGEMLRKERLLKKQIDKDGYETIFLRKNNKPKNMKVHRLVAEAFIEKHKGKNIVNHKDSVRNNNYYKNLEWCTHKENIIHSHSKGLSSNKGEKHPSSRLSENDILFIRKSNLNKKELAFKFNTSYSNALIQYPKKPTYIYHFSFSSCVNI